MSTPSEGVHGRVALVTGAAGGIGAAAAHRLAMGGADVILADRDASGLARARERIEGAGAPGKCTVAVFDQSDPHDVSRLEAEHLGRLPRLDIAVLAAGYGRYGEILSLPLETWQRHLDVNLTGTFLVLRAAAARMAACGNGGSVVVIGSTASSYPTDLFGAYAAAKAGVLMLARVAAAELGSHRIRVNTIMPGVIHTPMTDGLLSDDATRELIHAETPLGRSGHAEDVAAAVAFLAGDDAAFITGTSLLIDGGQTLHGLPRWFSTDHRVPGAPEWTAHSRRSHLVAS
ncbi:NAD(P)-dependent dehydrogenase (short-subunit alcohol dehydrogenase family) [Thermocatellispora tengchongensis]|uniref:NAD(P)-dependent dehydrogenase (Short-subunit alcohol dehydrogenase family) n=1 Tax=Thermocatellispora tengchongensis TaxID=1073253 RepID=A0A840PBL5_9ACTN|nr:SDR family NAD(P)-dependent oxidoreductase [Thermocatellispora tengchongensis]MBB5136076.1 NAD(P)-dependent dehydrogenase (short-subunit alcohol dehydrogenase family) [Thermocatellispora tengchongensis]